MSDTERSAEPQPPEPVQVERWPTEIPLLMLVILAAAGIWLLLAVTIIGIIYALLIGLVLFVAHLTFVAYVRGNAVRLGPDQFPELYQRVIYLSRRLGLRSEPEAYLMEAGGTLNALATRFLRSEIIVLYSDLLEACGDNQRAADMIIAHELAHHRCGHLRWNWLLAPGLLVPFLGSGYSRACEYTCDRFGTAACGDVDAALFGLSLLSAGPKHAPGVNLQALVRQREGLDTGWMTIGKWLMSHPPMCDRVAALQPQLLGGAAPLSRGPIRALSILALVFLLPMLGGLLAVAFVGGVIEGFRQTLERQAAPAPAENVQELQQQVERDFEELAHMVGVLQEETGSLPADIEEVYAGWQRLQPGIEPPLDPFDGAPYGYATGEDTFYFWSSGPDGASGTDDDIYYFPE